MYGSKMATAVRVEESLQMGGDMKTMEEAVLDVSIVYCSDSNWRLENPTYRVSIILLIKTVHGSISADVIPSGTLFCSISYGSARSRRRQ
jgi:hypothetical protein